MLKKFFLFLVLLALFPLAGASLTVERTIEGAVESDGTVDVLLKLKLRDANVDSVIITEQLPEGWELVEASPTASDFGNGKFKWLLYDSPMRDRTFSYTLKAPPDFSQPVLVSGDWRVLEEIGLIEGDAVLQPKPIEPEQPPVQPPVSPQPPADYTLIIIAGFVLIVLAVIVVVFVLRKKPEPKPKKQ